MRRRDPVDQFLRDLGNLFRARRMYPSGNEQVTRAARKAVDALAAVGDRVRIARIGDDLVVEDRTVPDPPAAVLALLDALSSAGREGVQFDPDTRPEDLSAWVERVVSGQLDGFAATGIRTGSLHLTANQGSAGMVDAAAGYLSLMPGVRDALSDLAEERSGGLVRAREIVRAIAGQLATGEMLMNPIRGLKTHDDYTFTHALNVCVIASAIARSMGLHRGLTDTVGLAALCHDVGKEKIPPEILNKEGALDAREKAIMDQHPLHGAALLLRLPERVDPLLPVVAYQHHLGTDGSGYPARPSTPRIHPASLLVAVADTYDALRTVRSYQRPVSEREAFAIMLRRWRQGKLHGEFLGVFAGLLGVLQPGDPVTLSDGRQAFVAPVPGPDPLRPTVRTENGQTVPLAAHADLWVEALGEP